MPDEVMLVIEHESGVWYQNQVGGNACWQGEVEGVLAPLELDPEASERIMSLFGPEASQGIRVELADVIDEILSSDPATNVIRVDRERLEECWEAWIYVVVASPDSIGTSSTTALAPALGFGAARGVLTWPNSD